MAAPALPAPPRHLNAGATNKKLLGAVAEQDVLPRFSLPPRSK